MNQKSGIRMEGFSQVGAFLMEKIKTIKITLFKKFNFISFSIL